MFPEDLIQQLARELHDAERTRTQVEHFSKRFPGMTIADGYAVSVDGSVFSPIPTKALSSAHAQRCEVDRDPPSFLQPRRRKLPDGAGERRAPP